MTNANDPWGTPATETETVVYNPPTSVGVNVSNDANYATAILKAGTSYGAPSVSLRGANAADLRNQVRDNLDDIRELLTYIADLGNGFANVFDKKNSKPTPAQNPQQSSNGYRPNTAAPAGASEGPGPAPMCNHGAMVWRSGIAKGTGKAYSLWGCTAPRDQQCKAVYPN